MDRREGNPQDHNQGLSCSATTTNGIIGTGHQEEMMGSGDARTRRGKIFRGSHGKTRPKGRKKRKPLKVTAARAGRGKAH
jgi:30S ribosomal protein S31